MSLPTLAGAWLSLYALWWLFVGEWSWQDAVWGAVIATAAAAAAGIAKAVGLGATRPNWRWLSEAAAVPWQIVVDLGIVAQVLASSILRRDRRSCGRFVRRDTGASGSEREATARRAWIGLVATYSPNAYVVDTDSATGVALLHDMQVHRGSEAPA